MNGITGRMGYRQHLVRSILAIRDEGGVELADGSRLQVDPILVGRNLDRVREIAERHGVERYTTNLAEALANPDDRIYFDAQLTTVREQSILDAIAAGKDVYTEKPISESLEGSLRLAKAAAEAGIKDGVVHDKLYLPGLLKLKRLIDGGFFGRILSVRGEFGYWVFEGDWQAAQRPSWNYRKEDGGGMATDMFCHWNYVMENLFGSVQAVTAKTVTHIPQRWDERGEAYQATADDAAYGIFELEGDVIAAINSSWATRVHRDELVEFHVDGTEGSAVAGLHRCVVQHRSETPKPVWNPDLVEATPFRAQWHEVPDNGSFDNGFKAQWEQYLRFVVGEGNHPYDFMAGARGVRLAEAGLQSSLEGRRIELKEIHA
ncbi:Gfo/Idh/MocA family protein [Leekyejoonella antrihumi]|uniref:Gfo/Idh/MocA family oxidoreductase n=1 Tax=Leekyejoonella antrihumi TaxID=1660198 RepID=A0A563DV56_9MICO|nr:Gfo/Idh/MocA family oxidoreductase [Leekyejoonella antrihumi]TWP34147.1 Gfo/Idh/MocA family oxidoreductase [Leekyejoonella antrihumi]